MFYFTVREICRNETSLYAWFYAFFLFIMSENAVNFQNHMKDNKVLPDTMYLTTEEFAVKYCLFPPFSRSMLPRIVPYNSAKYTP